MYYQKQDCGSALIQHFLEPDFKTQNTTYKKVLLVRKFKTKRKIKHRKIFKITFLSKVQCNLNTVFQVRIRTHRVHLYIHQLN
jgi:hypothetical protein